MRFNKIIALSALIFLCSCRQLVRVEDKATFARYLSEISALNAKMTQVKASLDIKGRGFFGSFFHEQADIVAQKPDKLYWSLRSFFGSPALVIASDGRYLTMYDFSGGSNSAYQKFLLKEESYLDLLEFKFHPQSLIYLLMAQVPLGSNIEIKSLDDKLEISSDLDDHWVAISLVDIAQKRVLKTRLVNSREGISYKANYDDFALGIDFPQLLVLQVKGQSKSADLEIKLSNLDINGDQVSAGVFYLKPH